jgi:TrmH family RNA methyltransferase
MAGVDEVGRGPLAGPGGRRRGDPAREGHDPRPQRLEAAPARERERLDREIRRRAVCCSVAEASVEEIDRFNILRAALLAMRRAVEGLGPAAEHRPRRRQPAARARHAGAHRDRRRCAGARDLGASIIAKVHRDRLLVALHDEHPQYGFDGHKGYSTPEHLARCASTARAGTTGAASRRFARRSSGSSSRGSRGRRKIDPVSSRDNPLLVRLRKLARHPGRLPQARPGPPRRRAPLRRLACPRSASGAARARRRERVADGAHAALSEAAEATVVVADATMAELSSLDTPAAAAFVVPLPAAPAIRGDAPSVVLDRVQDAGNVGSILRSAAAFGFSQVIALEGTASLWSPKVLRAAMGAHFALDLIENRQVDALAALTLPLIGTGSHAEESVADAVLDWPCAWVFGNEGAGASAAVQQCCARVLRIPQPGGEESLNVGAAAAICLYESHAPTLAGDRHSSLPIRRTAWVITAASASQ